jgi:protein-disulfide isomerase
MNKMKGRILLTCAAAGLALAGCKKSGSQGSGPAPDEKVTITQANPPPGGTWADVVNQTSSGYLMGNPNAKVKLIEIASLGCPYCKRFESEGVPTLVEKYIKPGTVSWEFRPYPIHGPVDIAAALIAQCNGPKNFFPLAQAMYQDQETWMGKVEKTPQDKLSQIQNLPPNQMFVALASLAGLQDWAAARGVPQAKSSQCLTDQKMINQQVQITNDITNEYPDFYGTPSFVLNGKLLPKEVGNWAALKPQLDAAVK